MPRTTRWGSPIGGIFKDVGDYPADGSWVDSPTIIGTEGQSKRIEGFEIKLSGEIPAGMEMRYNVHVQNKGWLYDENDTTNWPKDGAYAGTRGESLRIEAVKIVLTDSDGQPVPGYSVQYRGHVQNVGDQPADESQWFKDGDQLGTVGSSQRLEALLVQVVKTAIEPVVYDTAGTYGPETGTQVIDGDVIVKAEGITLRNLHINGDLYIGTDQVVQKADESTAATMNDDQINTEPTVSALTETELRNVYIAYFSRMSEGTGVSIAGTPNQPFSFSLPGGTQFTAITPGTGTGTGAPMQITAASSGGSPGGVSVGGAIGSLSLQTPGTQLSLLPGCQVQLLSLQPGALNCGILTPLTAMIQNLLVQGTGAIFSGLGAIQHADILASGAVFATRPGAFTVAPGVTVAPNMPALPDSGGGGYTPTQSQPVISPSGAVAFPTTVTISSQGADAIYYTTDGSDPTLAGAQNTKKVVGGSTEISVTSNITLKAIATRSGYYNSAIASGSYTQAASADLTGIAISTNIVTSPTVDNFSFASNTYDYPNVTAANDVEGITVTPSGIGVIKVADTTVASGASLTIPVSYKIEKTITIVNQEPGKTPKTYTIKVTPSSGVVTPKVTLKQSPITVNTTTLDVNTADVFEIKPGTSGVLSNVTFRRDDYGIMVGPSISEDVRIPMLKDCTFKLYFDLASVTLDGITYPNIQLNGQTLEVTVNTYISLVNTGNGTVADYEKAGIHNVVTGNLTGINQAVVAARAAAAGAELNKTTIQNLVNGYIAGANSFAVALENNYSKIQTELFNLSITGAKDSLGNLLNGDKTITVTSNKNGTVFNQAVNFTDGSATVPVTLGNIGAHTLTVAVPGVVIPTHDVAVTVYSKLNFSPADTVSGYTVADGPVVVIPPDNNGTPVTAIGANAFKENQTLTGVTIPASVKTIGTSAFFNCPSLESVTLTPTSTLKTIGNYAFKTCVKLTPFQIPASVITIGDEAFYSCSKFCIVTFADNSDLTTITIGEAAFQSCNITTLTIPAKVTTIAARAFQMNTALTSITFAADSKLTTIDNGAFFACPLTTITNIPADVTISAEPQTMGINNTAGFIAAYTNASTGGPGTYNYSSGPSLTWSKQ